MNRYYILFDTTKKYEDRKFAMYFEERTNTDIAGYIEEFIKQNNTELKHIRLNCFETKKQWQESYRQWIKQIK